jgi:hypothetical protein
MDHRLVWALVLAGYFAVVKWVLPRLGVPV